MRCPGAYGSVVGDMRSMKVLPSGRTSRYAQHYGVGPNAELKPVTLTANAVSVGVVGHPDPERG
jgi:hypothetical protein